MTGFPAHGWIRLMAAISLGVGLNASGAAQDSPPWSLAQILAYAKTNSPDARLAQYRITSARASLQQARSGYWPRVQFQSSYTRTDNPMQVFGAALNQQAYRPSLDFNDVPDADNLNVRGLLTVPLYAGGQTAAARDVAQAHSQAARRQAEVVEQTIAFEAVQAYHTIRKTRAFERAADAAVHSFSSHLATARNRFEHGTALKTDVLDLEVKLAQAREDLTRVRHARSLALRGLRNLLGLAEQDFEILEEPEPAPEDLPPISDDLGAVRRPEWLVLQEETRVAEAQLRRAQGGYKPRLNAFGSLDYDRGWEFDGDGRSYTGGLLLQWDIWDGQLTRGKVSAARAELDAILERQRKLQLAIDLEQEEARLHHEEAMERLSVSHQSVTHAEESVALTRTRFEQGHALATQLIDAETALIEARVRRAEADADARIALAAWHKALGIPQLADPNHPSPP